jgi:tetratricopeptide (TPR) repeat protein
MGSPLQQRGHVNSFLGQFDEARADYDRSMELEMARGNNNAPFFALFRAYVHIHESDPEAAIAELTELAASAEELGVEGTDDIKINCLGNVAQIATHTGDYATAEAALAERAILMLAQAQAAGTEQFQRAQESGIVFMDALLAARQGDAETARAKADEYTALVEPDANPRKMEPVHQILGMTEFYEGNYAAAAEELAQAAPGNVYAKYYRAVALDESGQSDEADALFDELAVWNFNGLNYALIRADVLERVAL